MNSCEVIDTQLARLDSLLRNGLVDSASYLESVSECMGVLLSARTTEGATHTDLAGEHGDDGRVEAGTNVPSEGRDKC